MTNVFGTQSMTIRDSEGFTARLLVNLFAATGTALATAAVNWRSAVDAVTNGLEVAASGVEQYKITSLGYGAQSQYSDSGMKLQIKLLGTSTGRLKTLSIPCPKLTCFLADQITMNSADTATAALITLIQTVVCSNDMVREQFVVIDGVFVDHRKVRKISPYTRNAAESGPA